MFLRSLLFNIGFYGVTTLLALLLFPALLLPRHIFLRTVRLWAWAVDGLLVNVIGADIEVRGADRLQSPCLVACKHQSAWETIALNRIIADPCFVLKRELTWIPFFGWYLLKTGQVAVNRAAGPRALKAMLQDAAEAVAGGRQLVIFPEGTRVPPGESRPYHPGVAALYSHLDVPVVPVAVNSGLTWGRRAFLKRPRRVILSALEPIPPGLDRSTFMRRLQNAIEEEARTLEAEVLSRERDRPAAP
ncbi:MAG: lysophospholipid acyltransferase family protein [Alphaproteobacteria bacterium]|jgi:1-acyl-sn-glycerol-3-phosphate acyltransferase|nr:lysophospholipid acyltransferase family protein [Alphaproteobacteria bacterium]